jgi:hypothetical protein
MVRILRVTLQSFNPPAEVTFPLAPIGPFGRSVRKAAESRLVGMGGTLCRIARAAPDEGARPVLAVGTFPSRSNGSPRC